ncbi:MAG: hypothetical protein IJW49_07715 [Clostridia bacterium]|nr:hypothetical protein [Clostridia bacterium]
MEQKKMMRDTVLQYAKTVLCGVAVIALLAVAVLEMIPTKDVGVAVKEEVYAASQNLYANSAEYTTQIRGVLRNSTKNTVYVESIRVVIGDGSRKMDVVLPAAKIAPNAEYEVVKDFVGVGEFDTVHELYVTIGGEETRLTNRSVSAFPLTGLAIGCLVLLIPAVFLLVRSIKGCHYLYQERKIREKSL